MAAPPLEEAVQESTDWAFWFDVAVTPTGADGTFEGVAVVVALALVPLALVAVTLKV